MKLRALGLMIACGVALAACSKEAPQGTDAAEAAKTKDTTVKIVEGAEAKATTDAGTATTVSADDPNTMAISVPTMQCETCAETITKGVKDVQDVQKVNVDVDKKTVFVTVANRTPELQARVEQAIAKVGYSTPSATRDPKAYEGLPSCCKEGGME